MGDPVALAWARVLRGKPSGDAELDALRALWRGELTDGADPVEVALRAGDWDVAATLDLAPGQRAILVAGRGEDVEEAAVAAELAAAETGQRWDHLEAWRARGLAALRAGDPARAAGALAHVWRHTRREGVDEPGAFPVGPDLVEALVATGEDEQARAVTAALAAHPGHPWAALGARRGTALLDRDPRALADVAGEYARRGLHFDAARTLLVLGRMQRRTSAIATLERATEGFAAHGAHGWAQVAAAERDALGSVPRGAPDDLTRAERRVVELAAAGRSNREIARSLSITINTVETHLSRAYAKLGVAGREELSRLPAP